MPRMCADLQTGVGTFSSLSGLRDVIAPVGTRPPQRIRAVLLISAGSLSSDRFASFIDCSLAPCFNSKLLGDTMAAAWVQNCARWDGFSSSQFSQINSLKRKTLETYFSLFKLLLKFSDRRRKSKRSKSGKNRGEPPPGPHWAGRTGLADPPCSRGWSGPVSRVPPFFRFLSPWEKVGPVNLHKKLQKIKRKTIYKNPCLVFRPRMDVRALLPW
jgi:hypothetical protein